MECWNDGMVEGGMRKGENTKQGRRSKLLHYSTAPILEYSTIGDRRQEGRRGKERNGEGEKR